jgi:hypothetical protein
LKTNPRTAATIAETIAAEAVTISGHDALELVADRKTNIDSLGLERYETCL